MTKNRNLADEAARRSSASANRARPPGLAFLALALVGLAQAGCVSDGCSTCGNFGSRLVNSVQNVGARVFNHHGKTYGDAGCSTCGTAGGPVIGTEVPVVVPGPMVLPPPSNVVVPSSPATAPAESPLDLKPLDSTPGTGSGATGNGTQGASNNKKSSYEVNARRNNLLQNRSTGVARAIHSQPENAGTANDESELFERIPPMNLPSDVARKAQANSSVGTAPAPAAPAVMPPAANPTPTPVSASKPAPPPAVETTSAAEGAGANAGAAVVLPPIAATASPNASPGIRRCGFVDPSLGGGSVPSLEGLDWLKEKGYRTFVDLRPRTELDPAFADAVIDRGMVYVTLPILANPLDPNRLARFDDLIAQSNNRPLYFCDTEGTIAGLAWYIHRRTVDQYDGQAALHEAEEIGLTDREVKLAEAYLAVHKPRARSASLASTTLATNANPDAKPTPAAAAEVKPSSTPPAPVAPPAPLDSPPVPMLPGEDRPQASHLPKGSRDASMWRPLAALVLTGVGVPLAYWSRSAFTTSRSSRKRASLPAAEPRPSSSPAGLDA
jgi:protein tyrosine phosphatase (PTP) superfamily phosphohydrolase (DUF442 family)